MLTQDIATDIEKRGKPANVVIKLDMTKVYDRLSWRFLINVLEHMVFNTIVVDMIWRLIAYNWYFILINEKPHGVFHSSRGIEQGNPLSPVVFILSAGVLSRALNKLFYYTEFKTYVMPKLSEKLNYLGYTNDTIIFAAAER